MNEALIQPVVQYGFLGFSAVLLAVVVWLVRRMLAVLEQNNRVIEAMIDAVQRQTAATEELSRAHRELRDKIIARPCIAAGEAR